jgi:mannose-6-phosphate isomerase-like protein (cupin superfamily)
MTVRPARAWWRVALVALVACAVVGLAVAAYAAKAKEPTRRIVFATTEPQNAPGQTMNLQQVEIDPGAKLPEHFHAGTQIATIKEGVLTYQVVSGSVMVVRNDGSTETLSSPNTVKLRVGDSIVENEGLVHYGANEGKKLVVIEVAALLHTGEPLATPVGTGATGDTIKLETTIASQSRTLYQTGPNNESTYGWNRLTGTATLNGQPVSIEMLATVDYTKGNGPFSGVITFTFADGSTIGVSMVGTTTAQPNGTDASFASTLGVIGGTGQYVNTTGYGTFTGTRSAALGTDVGAVFTLQLRPRGN